MIDVNDYRARLEACFLAADFTKRAHPVDTEDGCYVAMCVDDTVNFDMDYWNPAVTSLIRGMIEAGTKEFYRLDVYYDKNDTLWVTASLGDSNGQREN